MAVIWLEPYVSPPAGFAFPGGIAGGGTVEDSTRRSATTLYPLGTLARDANGNEYIYVKAGAIIPVNAAVFPNADLSDVRQTSAANQPILGVADAAFAANDNGFILSRGTVNVLTGGAVAVGLVGSGAGGTVVAADATTVATRGATILVNSASPQKLRLL